MGQLPVARELLGHLHAIGFWTDALRTAINPRFFRVKINGHVATQQGTPQVDWTRVMAALHSVDPGIQTPGQRQQYQDVVKVHGRRLPNPAPAPQPPSLGPVPGPSPSQGFTADQLALMRQVFQLAQHETQAPIQSLQERIQALEARALQLESRQ
jgi:hypothetical protein